MLMASVAYIVWQKYLGEHQAKHTETANHQSYSRGGCLSLLKDDWNEGESG